MNCSVEANVFILVCTFHTDQQEQVSQRYLVLALGDQSIHATLENFDAERTKIYVYIDNVLFTITEIFVCGSSRTCRNADLV